MGGNGSLTRGEEAADASKVSDQSAERKKSLVNWMNLIKPANEEKDHWVSLDAFSLVIKEFFQLDICRCEKMIILEILSFVFVT